MTTRTGAGNGSVAVSSAGPEPTARQDTDGEPFEDLEFSTEVVYSGSDQDSESGDDEDAVGSGGDRRGVKRERSEDGQSGRSSGGPNRAYSDGNPALSGAKPGKKTRGRVKIKMEFIDNKLRRYTTFSKRKTGIMKKAYELSTLTGTQVLLLVASETGHVYTFATRKLQPMITSETGKALIQTCLNSPDSPPRADPSGDQRMSATGFEETDLTYQVAEADTTAEGAKDPVKPTFGPPSSSSSGPLQSGAPSWQPPASSSNGAVLKTPAGVVLPGGLTLMSGAQLPPGTHTIPLSQLQGPAPAATLQAPPTQPATLLRLPATVSLTGAGVSQQLQTIQVQPSSQQTSNHSGSDTCNPASSTAGLSVVSSSSSSSSAAGHMMYPSGPTVMYATPSPSLADGGLTVLNAFPPSHAPSHDPGAVQQVFLTSLPPVAAQIPVSAVQLHPMVIGAPGSGGGGLAELQVVSLDVHQSKEN
ncbi:PREDICTED: serum response factor-like isoform X2 [Poecilia mexicana]|uniref:Serum response factor n=1 Tax=Poecilia mexicana TaxID=48701 RepID=A0A3B3YWY7_9TELE|nr:PREDICTED: serum response factor-like isoform X2 [Poecilia mexicana]